MSTFSPIVISVAPNGARKTKAMLPQIPLTPEEHAEEARKCQAAGAVLYHLHVRGDAEEHILDVERYQAATQAIRAAVGDRIIVQATTEAVGVYTPEQQIALVHALKPEAASMAIRELIPDPSYEAQAKEFFAWIKTEGIFPQYILYSPEEVRYFAALREKGVIPAGKAFILLVLGKKHAPMDSKNAYARPADLAPFLEAYNATLAGSDVTWAVCAFGGYEKDCMLAAVEAGGNVRIGFENNHLLDDGSTAPDNASLVQQFVKALSPERPIADVDTVRAWFGYSYPAERCAA